MQTSQVLNQTKLLGAGDTDDCWVASSQQAVNAVMPWLPIVSVPTFRKNAGDPDDGKNDGGNLHEIVEGITNTYPVLTGKLRILRQAPWADLLRVIAEGRPVSVAVKSSDLPQRLQYGFGGLHQVTIARKGTEIRFANPLAPVYSHWDTVSMDELRAAIMAYGSVRVGQRSVFAVALPTETEALRLHPLFKTELEQAAKDAAGPLVDQAYKSGFATAKDKAVKAVQAV